MIGSIRSPEHLLRFFRESGMTNVVLRVADLVALPLSAQSIVVGTARKARVADEERLLEERGPSGWLKHCFPAGYVVLSVDTLCDGRFSMPELELLQAAVETYKDHRRQRGRPARQEPCNCVTGREPQHGGHPCRGCGGSGTVTVLLELSDEERALAYRA